MSELRERLAGLSPEQRELLARRLAERTAPGAWPAAEPIAVVAAACRLPGGVQSPDEFWQLLLDGRDVVTDVPSDRWDSQALFDADPSAPDRINSRRGGFLDSLDQFDAGFFGIAPREAAMMDPQQRLLLEVAWEAFEAGGQPVERLAGSQTGVFVGAHSHSADYWLLQLAQSRGFESHATTGSAHSILANRISYLLDLRGPSLTVDTACSSSLVAVHLACQSLRTGECDLALAGGVNLLLLPATNFGFAKLEVLSTGGCCRAFDDGADGIARGEGCVAVLLKRLADAVRECDPVLAVIRGSAVNQDGASNGLTAPNGPSQEAVVGRALQLAGIPPERIGMVETHGTGTSLGDPVEVEALANVLGPQRGATHRCYLGAVKTNLGHLEGAAGVAGLLKAVLCLQHRQVPPNLHFTRLNPHIELAGTPFVIPTSVQEWVRGALPLAAGVSSFGFGGTNAHVVLEEYEAPAQATAADPARDRVLALSARSPDALAALVTLHADRLEALPDSELADYVYTATVRRSHGPRRIAAVGRTPRVLAGALRARLDDASRAGSSLSPGTPGIVFMYPGQGGQWAGMGRELFETEPVFRDALLEVAASFARLAPWDLLDVLRSQDTQSRVAATAVAQPAIFALQVALTALWRSWGIMPAAIVGHSAGEAAAAHAAGVLTLDDAVAVAFHRGRLLQAAEGHGRMAHVELSEAEVEEEFAAVGNGLAVAAVNGPGSTVISGPPAAIEAVTERFTGRGVMVRPLAVDFASHGPHMDPFREPLRHALAAIRPVSPRLPLISTVSGRWSEAGDYDAAYWSRNIRQTVRFAPAIDQLLRDGFGLFLEVGPHPALGVPVLAMAAQCKVEVVASASLRRGQPARTSMLGSLCELYEGGARVAWQQLAEPGARTVPLPAYPWQRRRHWLESPDASALAFHVTGQRYEGRPDDAASECYSMTWEHSPVAWPAPEVVQDPGSRLPGTAWLIVPDRGGVAQALAARLTEAGAECSIADLEEGGGVLLERVWDGVVCCAGIDATWNATEPLATVIQITHALAGQGTRLWIVTRDARQVVPDDMCDAPAQAALWGFGRSLALEYPELWGGLVDAGHDLAPDEIALLVCRELVAADDEDQVAWRRSGRFVARLTSRAAPSPGQLSLGSDGSYLVTGGFGSLGPRVARWLADQGARHIVLLGRSGPPDPSMLHGLPAGHPAATADRVIRELVARGVTVRAERGDVSDRRAMQALFTSLAESGHALRGVVHTAAAIVPQRIAELTPGTLDESLRAKVEGARILDELTRDAGLDFFVCFSSIAGVFGGKAMAAYAAANEFLSAIVRHRKARGLAATCVEWGAWHEAWRPHQELRGDVERLGILELDDSRAFALLTGLVLEGAEPTLVAALDWSLLRDAYGARGDRPFLRRFGPRVAAQAEGEAAEARASLRSTFLLLPPHERRGRMVSLVRSEVAHVLGLAADQEIGDEAGLFALGLDSLMAVQVRRRLARVADLTLPATLLFNHPTVSALSSFLLEALSAGADSERDLAPNAASLPDALQVSNSDGDVHALLLEEIARLPADLLRGRGGAGQAS